MRTRVGTNELSSALSVTRRAITKRADREGWEFTEEPVRGGRRRLYDTASLPADVRAALAEKVLSAAPAAPRVAPPPATVAGSSAGAPSSSMPTVGDLAQWQLEVAAARAALIEECARIAGASGISVAKAEELLCSRAKDGVLEAGLVETMRRANARRGEGRVLSAVRLAEWRKCAQAAPTPAERLRRLAPGTRGKRWTLSDDVAVVLAKYRAPNKPALRSCVADVLGGMTAPGFDKLYARCRRELAKLPQQVFHVGRHTGAELKALQVFHRREFLCLQPNDVWIGDGHSAKLKIAHPETGNPFVPEVTVVMDVATRYIVGWSVSLSENCIAVADALRHGVSRHGVPLVYYSDRGAGQTAKMLDAPMTGILVGLGVRHETGRPNHPQARGAIERLWPTVLIRLARRFATFQGRGADRDTLRRVTREIDQALRAAKSGEVTALPRRLPTWQEFLAALEQEIAQYNETHRHRSLPKLDGANNATPAEYRAAKLAGVEIHLPPAAELQALFMPSVLRVARRGEVKLWNGVYFHRDLMLVDGEQVRVAFDIHDPTYVLVRRSSGELVCRAELGGNAAAYMPLPFIERLREERAARRRGLLEKKLDEVEAERRGVTAAGAAIEPAELARLEQDFAAEQAAPAEKPLELMDEFERYALWKTLHERRAGGEQLDARLSAFYEGFEATGRLWLEAEQDFERGVANT